MLCDSTANGGFKRLHFDAKTGLGLELYPDGCNLVDLRDEASAAETIRPFIELGDALSGEQTTRDALRAFVEMPAAAFHQRVEELLNDHEGVLYHSVRFHSLDEQGRSGDVFGCDSPTLARTLEMLRLALTVEMGAGGTLGGWSSATWPPWGLGELIGGAARTTKAWGPRCQKISRSGWTGSANGWGAD